MAESTDGTGAGTRHPFRRRHQPARHTVLDLARLSHIHERAGQLEEGPELIALNNDFRAALRQAAHNRAIIELMQRLDAQLAVYDSRTGGSADDRVLTLAEHGRILEAVKARDGKRAQEEMSLHVNRSRDLRINALAQGELSRAEPELEALSVSHRHAPSTRPRRCPR